MSGTVSDYTKIHSAIDAGFMVPLLKIHEEAASKVVGWLVDQKSYQWKTGGDKYMSQETWGQVLGMSGSKFSRTLIALREKGWVSQKRAGTITTHRLTDKFVGNCCRYFDTIIRPAHHEGWMGLAKAYTKAQADGVLERGWTYVDLLRHYCPHRAERWAWNDPEDPSISEDPIPPAGYLRGAAIPPMGSAIPPMGFENDSHPTHGTALYIGRTDAEKF